MVLLFWYLFLDLLHVFSYKGLVWGRKWLLHLSEGDISSAEDTSAVKSSMVHNKTSHGQTKKVQTVCISCHNYECEDILFCTFGFYLKQFLVFAITCSAMLNKPSSHFYLHCWNGVLKQVYSSFSRFPLSVSTHQRHSEYLRISLWCEITFDTDTDSIWRNKAVKSER